MLSQPKQGNYFMLPNEIFNMDLSTGEIAVYAFLMRMEDRKTFQCYPSFETIGKAVGMGSKNTVMKYVRMLEEKELIETEHTVVEHRDGTLKNGNLMYKILPIKQAVDAFHRRQLNHYGRRNSSKRLLVLHKSETGLKIGRQTGESNDAVMQRRCGSQRPATPTASHF